MSGTAARAQTATGQPAETLGAVQPAGTPAGLWHNRARHPERRLNKVVSFLSSSALALIACFVLAYPSHAPAQSAPSLSATEAWVRVTPGSEVAAAYMTL